MDSNRPKSRKAARLLTLAVGLALTAGCDGENFFKTGGSLLLGEQDSGAIPVVDITIPTGDSLASRPLGDSVFVSAHITDDASIASVNFYGVAIRGDKDLGTQVVVDRYDAKTITLPIGVEDTTINRYMIPTPEDTRERVYFIVEAFDTLGGMGVDTVSVALGGPHVRVLDLVDGSTVQTGLALALRVEGTDPLGITQMRLDVSGAITQNIILNVSPPVDSVVLDTLVIIPNGVTGDITITGGARNNLDFLGVDGPYRLTILAGGQGDVTAPKVKHKATVTPRMEMTDSIYLSVTGADDAQGSGVARMGYTVMAISPSRGDTLIQTQQVAYSPARTGTVTSNFAFLPFNVGTLNLPDTVVFHIFSWAIDAAGNCGAGLGADTLASYPCTTLPGGQIAVIGSPAVPVVQMMVAGQTVALPTGGTIMDAVVDTVRRNLYLSNRTQDRIEIFRLQSGTYLPSVPVGSEPWGMTLNQCAPLSPAPGCGDTLIVANSGGTNLSNVYLGPVAGAGPIFEDGGRRLLTPDVILFDVERRIDDTGLRRYKVVPIPQIATTGFSDRPQLAARDSTGQLHYATMVIPSLLQVGTLRRVMIPPGATGPEVKMFVEHANLTDAPDWVALAHVDGADVVVSGVDPNDQMRLTDHQPGSYLTKIVSSVTTVEQAAAEIAGAGSDVLIGSGRFDVEAIGFSVKTLIASSGDGGWVAFGEGGTNPVGRVIMYDAANNAISPPIPVADLVTNEGEPVSGLSLNYDGTLGVARGRHAYFFTTDLRPQGIAEIDVPGGAGIVMHPLHADAPTLTNAGSFRPDTHLAFIATGERTVDIFDTFHFFRMGRLFVQENITGPMKASLPFPEDNLDAGGVPLQCVTQPVTDQVGRTIGQAVEIFQGGNFNLPWPADGAGGGSVDGCVVLKLYGVTETGGVVVLDVLKADILRNHPARP
ncbi:MAG: hypothetical protein OEZ65_04580 [Gemmatimonadota bacterium]|nr:hypothetical protein [Gemmatimonadota bacterium]